MRNEPPPLAKPGHPVLLDEEFERMLAEARQETGTSGQLGNVDHTNDSLEYIEPATRPASPEVTMGDPLASATNNRRSGRKQSATQLAATTQPTQPVTAEAKTKRPGKTRSKKVISTQVEQDDQPDPNAMVVDSIGASATPGGKGKDKSTNPPSGVSLRNPEILAKYQLSIPVASEDQTTNEGRLIDNDARLLELHENVVESITRLRNSTSANVNAVIQTGNDSWDKIGRLQAGVDNLNARLDRLVTAVDNLRPSLAVAQQAKQSTATEEALRVTNVLELRDWIKRVEGRLEETTDLTNKAITELTQQVESVSPRLDQVSAPGSSLPTNNATLQAPLSSAAPSFVPAHVPAPAGIHAPSKNKFGAKKGGHRDHNVDGGNSGRSNRGGTPYFRPANRHLQQGPSSSHTPQVAPSASQPIGFAPQPVGFAPQAAGFAPQGPGAQPTGFIAQPAIYPAQPVVYAAQPNAAASSFSSALFPPGTDHL